MKHRFSVWRAIEHRLVFSILACLIVGGVWLGLSIGKADSGTMSLEAFNAINEYRAEYGLSALVWDDDLATLASGHSQYMENTGSFIHSWERQDGIKGNSSYGYVECIANMPHSGGKTIAYAWMNSPPHKAGLLDVDISYGAVGMVGSYTTFMAR